MLNYLLWWFLFVIVLDIFILLVLVIFIKDLYYFCFIDFVNVWVENMERKFIIKCGLMEDISIDFSDGFD